MVNITKETYENNEIEVMTDKFGKLWLNERHEIYLHLQTNMMKTTKNADLN